MNFRPTRAKLITVLVAFAIWAAFLWSVRSGGCDCLAPRPETCASDYHWMHIIPGMSCHCSCTPLSVPLMNNAALLVPPLLLYAIWSLFQKRA
jgi:hypothetical protein